MTEATSNPTCPMSAMCRGMASKSISGMVSMIPGLVLIGFGVLVLFQPQILAWLIAIFLIVMGIGVLFMANVMRKFGARAVGGNGQ